MPGVRQNVPSSIHHAGDAAAGSSEGQHVISAKNRWSRVTLNFDELSPDVWCEFSFQMAWHAEEESRFTQDFAAIGVSFFTEDGSPIDFLAVPGLVRAQVDPHCAFIPG
ncbi:heparinase, partial [Corallococcus exiguus]|uniref:hypothetical protein n=1 Tax=Corallococcus exiguus TaxID=83462 RepID=UPI0017B163AF